jgi:hypothetical protein
MRGNVKLCCKVCLSVEACAGAAFKSEACLQDALLHSFRLLLRESSQEQQRNNHFRVEITSDHPSHRLYETARLAFHLIAASA